MSLIEPGQDAPNFTLLDQNEQPHTLADLKGKRVVLFFYPKDLTSGCTDEACQFEASLPEFNDDDTAVLGISILGTKSKAKFADKEGLSYPLLADEQLNDDGKPDPDVAKAYGVWVQKSMYGRTYMGIQRTTYLIDTDGTVMRRWDKVKVPGHAAEVLAAARAVEA